MLGTSRGSAGKPSRSDLSPRSGYLLPLRSAPPGVALPIGRTPACGDPGAERGPTSPHPTPRQSWTETMGQSPRLTTTTWRWCRLSCSPTSRSVGTWPRTGTCHGRSSRSSASPGDLRNTIQLVLACLNAHGKFDAVGLRLQEGEDFPFLAQLGFSGDLLGRGPRRCARHLHGAICRNS